MAWTRGAAASNSIKILTAIGALAAGAAQAKPWQPAPGIVQMALWPDGATIAKPNVTGDETATYSPGKTVAKGVTAVANVSRPTLSLYPAKGHNSGATVIVFPGGGYQILAIDLEGTEVCDWATTKGLTCAVLKYRVPDGGPHYDERCACQKSPAVPMALQDAQRAISILRRQAKTLGIDPHKIGVLGFSAGGHLVADVSTHRERAYKPMDAADREDFRPDFAVALYPGHLWSERDRDLSLMRAEAPDSRTPPTLIIQAEDDPVDDVRNSLTYFLALKAARVPAEMHIYAHGGHAFGLRPTARPITHWPTLAETWLHTIGIVQ
jgi:acetyl esterase/lipase